MITWYRHDSSDLGIFDKVVLRCVCDWLIAIDVNRLGLCSKRLHMITRGYLADNCYKTVYINKQKRELIAEIDRLDQRKIELENAMSYMDIYELHNNIKPDGYMCFSDGCIWSYCNVENIMNIYQFKDELSSCLYIKKGLSETQYNRISYKMGNHNWKRVFIPNRYLLKRPDIEMMFVPYKNNQFSKFHNCKVCKGEHSIQHCPKVKCNICKKKGHLTQRCPKAICGRCGDKGHILSRCPYTTCNKCGKKGHVSKRCRITIIK